MSFNPLVMFQVVAIVVIAFLGGVGLTFWILRKRIHADERERMQVDEHFFSNLKVEREFWKESRGIVFKEEWLVIRERLVYKQFPLSGWMPSERQVDGTIDTANIEKLIISVSQLISEATTPFSFKSVLRQLPGHLESAALSGPAQGRNG